MTRAAVFLVLLAVVTTAPVGASLTVSTDFREIVSDATLIVRGRITDVRAAAVPGKGIESIGTVAVDGVIKGTAASFVAVRVPGGSAGGRRFVMVGAPTLRVGEQAVFFLKRDPESGWRPIGLTQGIYRVQAEPLTGRPVVRPPVVAGRTAPLSGQTVRGDLRRTLLPVPEFESLVKLVMAMPAPPRAVPRGGGR
jgi:hypothetical protein